MDIASKILKKAEQIKKGKNTKEIILESNDNLIDTLRGKIEKLNKELLESKNKIIELQEELLNVRTSKRTTTRNESKTAQREKTSKVCDDKRRTDEISNEIQ